MIVELNVWFITFLIAVIFIQLHVGIRMVTCKLTSDSDADDMVSGIVSIVSALTIAVTLIMLGRLAA